jgi:hypothetical protein
MPLVGHPAMARTTAIVTMATKKIDRSDMLTRSLTGLYRSLSTMVKEGGGPANSC